MSPAATDVLIVGCGDIGERVGGLERSAGRHVSGLIRSEASAQRLRAAGIQPIAADLDVPAFLHDLPVKNALIYYFAPPPGKGVTDPRMEAFVSILDTSRLPTRVVLISTTGVYGDCRGEWVTEDRPPNPQVDRARRRLAAESSLRHWSEKSRVPIVILRVPGIYGRGYLPEERLRAREPVLREEESPFSNRIHADDLARACFVAGHHANPGALYNVSDGHPTTMTDFFYRVADVLGIPRPPAITLEQARRQLGEGMLSYLAESKRIDNRRLREELGVELMYPDLAAGLPSCFDRCG
ncbi:NAD-dependent dehydratase [Sulfuricaulis limicola]|uniref:NAD-dependent dehydratase n=1 Tax=Sulfuricaulis limicola TaxID=1620215 RepID=A0A1B4XGL4_9GAMM|nr:SDR family oxidoreductase [Sulfuricaulis limicola]BAV33960.1 NAD-dependent dehydratase [Sulfuricaulis limicola]